MVSFFFLSVVFENQATFSPPMMMMMMMKTVERLASPSSVYLLPTTPPRRRRRRRRNQRYAKLFVLPALVLCVSFYDLAFSNRLYRARAFFFLVLKCEEFSRGKSLQRKTLLCRDDIYHHQRRVNKNRLREKWWRASSKSAAARFKRRSSERERE